MMKNNNDSAEMSNAEIPVENEDKNLISLSDDMYPEAQEGETVSAQVEGVIKNKEDGSRCLYVQKIDGKDLGGEEIEEEMMSDEDLEEGISSFAKRNAGPMGYK